MEKALTLKEVAELLGLSYSTIFAKRHQIGFRLPGSRVWRVWPADLEKLRPQMPTPQSPITVQDYGAPLVRQPFRASAAREASKELDRLLALGRKPKKNGNP
ncbi:helix-turn-helix transcriptional regulator [Castellaniella sp.]|uniref:helix-turn-helix transcriptional regulator n=1 Tax=Castellaniella sp. TaxID=1955812 RepID=UPI003A8F6B14